MFPVGTCVTPIPCLHVTTDSSSQSIPCLNVQAVVCVRGRQSTMGYLCGAIELQLTSGRVVAFIGENSATFGDPFEYKLPSAAHPHTPNHTPNTSPGALRDLRFSGGRCLGIQLEPIRIQFEPERPQKSGRALSEPSAPREQRLGSTLAPPRVLHSSAELLNWKKPADERRIDRSRLAPSRALRSRESGRGRVLHCHDMRGGYNEHADIMYPRVFRGWGRIDVFVYFGHHRVSMPPKVWVLSPHYPPPPWVL